MKRYTQLVKIFAKGERTALGERQFDFNSFLWTV